MYSSTWKVDAHDLRNIKLHLKDEALGVIVQDEQTAMVYRNRSP